MDHGSRAGPNTTGLLYRLPVQSTARVRIGKEVDRLDEEHGATPQDDEPVDAPDFAPEQNALTAEVAYLARFPQRSTARGIGISERRWRYIVQGRAEPRVVTAEQINRIAAQYRIAPRVDDCPGLWEVVI